ANGRRIPRGFLFDDRAHQRGIERMFFGGRAGEREKFSGRHGRKEERRQRNKEAKKQGSKEAKEKRGKEAKKKKSKEGGRPEVAVSLCRHRKEPTVATQSTASPSF